MEKSIKKNNFIVVIAIVSIIIGMCIISADDTYGESELPKNQNMGEHIEEKDVSIADDSNPKALEYNSNESEESTEEKIGESVEADIFKSKENVSTGSPKLKTGTVFDVGIVGLSFRSEPVVRKETFLGVIPEGYLLTIYGEVVSGGRNWYNVEYKGNMGWVASQYIKITGEEPSVTDLIDPTASLNQDETEAYIWNFFKNKGLNDYAISGIMGNLYAESGIDSHNLQDTYEMALGYSDLTYTKAVDEGIYNSFSVDRAGYGLAQWTAESRKSGLLTMAKLENYSVGSLDLQLRFLWKELLAMNLPAKLNGASAVRAASDIFMVEYEKPADQGEAAKRQRAMYGNKYFTAHSHKLDQGGAFKDTDGRWKYIYANGTWADAGWIEDEHGKYFCYGNGLLYTNDILTFGSSYAYYVGNDGKLLKGHFQGADGKWRYSREDGNLVQDAGWIEDEHGKYFCYGNGLLYTNDILTFGSSYAYYVGNDGKLLKGHFQGADGKWRYSREDGNLVQDAGWIEDEHGKYFCYGNGLLYTNDILTFGSSYAYYVGNDGKLLKGHFQGADGKWRYSIEDGNLVRPAGWIEDEHGKYFCYENGLLYTNDILTFGSSYAYYVGNDGKLLKGHFQGADGKWRYSREDGNLVRPAGWIEDEHGKYFTYSMSLLYTNDIITFGSSVAYYADKVGRATLIKSNNTKMGIDVSEYQGDIDWDSVKASGIEFAMIRVGYRGWGTGQLVQDPFFEQNIKEATRVGIKVGIYFYTAAITTDEAVEEANFVHQRIRNYNIEYPVAFDFEDFGNVSTRYYHLDKYQRTAIAKKFLDTISQYGYAPMTYGNPSYFNNENAFDTSELVENYKVWFAHYLWASDAQDQYTTFSQFLADNKKTQYTYEGKNGQIHIWQFSSKGSIPGVIGNVDLNISYLPI